jgi:hypothetical protein
MLAAMMAGSRAVLYTTTTTLLSGNVSVPGGVTAAYFNVRVPGKGPYFTDTDGTYFVGAGGGGGVMLDVKLTVVPSETLSVAAGAVSFTVSGSSSGTLFTSYAAQAGNNDGNSTNSGVGGDGAYFVISGTTYAGGAKGTAGGNGGDGALTVLAGGGVVVTGGGGAGGGLVSPPGFGGTGGSVPGLQAGFANATGWGGGGAGYFNGWNQTGYSPSQNFVPAAETFSAVATVSW